MDAKERALFRAASTLSRQVFTSNAQWQIFAEGLANIVSHVHANWRLVYQSRSGPPSQPWLGPDIGDALNELAASRAAQDIVSAPIGFISDHVEVLYDLDTGARAVCDELGIRMVRAGTVGTHPAIIRMIAELIEREPELCAASCCPAGWPSGRKPCCA